MKQLVLDLSSGNTKVIEVTDPIIRPGGIIVKNYSYLRWLNLNLQVI